MTTLIARRESADADVFIETAAQCYHCGDECSDHTIFIDHKYFCCEGCKLVYSILHDHDLTQYYRIEKAPGINRRHSSALQYAWLDDPEVVARLADFNDPSQINLTLRLPQIHCSSCIWLLENLYRLRPGVLQSKVNFLKREAYVSIDPRIASVRQVVETLASIGYAPDLNFNSIETKQKARSADKSLYYRLGVAGFVFGNVMLLTFPEYLGLGESHYRQWFGYFNLLLSLPVIGYSAQPYLLSAWHGLRERYLNIDVPLALGIVTLFIRTAYEVLWLEGGGYADSLAGLVFFLLIGRWFQQKTYHQLSFDRDYKSYFPVSATLIRAGSEVSVTLDKLNTGDHLLVRHHELIPADAVLLKGNALIDYSFVTGESLPVKRKAGERVYAGGRQMGEAIELTVMKKVSNSYLTQLWNDAAFKKVETSRTASQIADKLGKRFTYVILTIALGTLVYWLPRNIDTAIHAFSAVLIIACPCAVALSIPFTLGNVIRIFGRHGFFLKNTNVIEHLAKVNTIVLDKTGTLTRAGEYSAEYDGEALSSEEWSAIHLLASQSTHPVSRQIAGYISRKGLCTRSGKMKPSSIVDAYVEKPGFGILANIDGMSIQICKSDDQGTDIFINGRRKGNFRIRQQYRKGLAGMLGAWKDKYVVHLVSGDNDQERHVLEEFIPPQHLHFDQSPKDKLNYVSTLMSSGKETTVMMIGDGLNDAGALQRSDVGIVITENTNNFTPACDAILDATRFNDLPGFIALSQRSMRIVYMAYGFAFVYNIIGLSYAVQGTLSPVIAAILMPLSSITIVLFGVGASSLAARHLLKR